MTGTLGGYKATWTTTSQELYDDATVARDAPVVKYGNNVYVLDDGNCLQLLIPAALIPVPELSEAVFTYTSVNGTGVAHVFNSQLWFSERQGSGQHKVYMWDGTTLTLMYTTTDGYDPGDDTERLVVTDDGSDIYIAYTAYTLGQNKGLIVRKYATGSWTNQGISTTSEAYVAPQGGMPGTGGNWYVTGKFLGATYMAYAIYSSNVLVHGVGTWEATEAITFATTGSILSQPCVFSGSVYFFAYGSSPNDFTLTGIEIATGAPTVTTFGWAASGRVGPLISYNGSLYCCIDPAYFGEEVVNGAVVLI